MKTCNRIPHVYCKLIIFVKIFEKYAMISWTGTCYATKYSYLLYSKFETTGGFEI